MRDTRLRQAIARMYETPMGKRGVNRKLLRFYAVVQNKRPFHVSLGVSLSQSPDGVCGVLLQDQQAVVTGEIYIIGDSMFSVPISDGEDHQEWNPVINFNYTSRILPIH